MEREGNNISSKNPPSRYMLKCSGSFPSDLMSEELVMWCIFATVDKRNRLSLFYYNSRKKKELE